MADTTSDTTQNCGTSCEDGLSATRIDWRKAAYTSLAIILLSQLALVVLGRLVGSALGWYLRRASSGRRAHLLSLMQMDQEKQRDERLWVGKPQDNAEERERQQAAGKPGADWRGVVGFFHPFWYVVSHTERPRRWM